MDTATRDLHSYHLARLLHMVPHLHRVYAENCFLVPLFFSCVSPAAKLHVKLVLLCLQRRFGPLCTPDVCGHILSFLSFPELAEAPTALLRSSPHRPNDENTSDNKSDGGKQQLPQLSVAKKRPRDETEASVSPSYSQPSLGDATEAEDGVAGVEKQLKEEVESIHKEKHQLEQQETPTVDLAESEKQIADQPMFLIRPPAATDSAVAAVTTTTHLFVRMVSEYLLNEETMNTYFGRYGQVSCTLLRQRLVPDDTHADGAVHTQDFIVTVDSMHNALQAVRNAYYRELVFIALHDPVYNTYTLADVDRMLLDVAVEVAEPPPRIDDGGAAEDSAAAASLRAFVPDVVLDGLPYWLTVDQLRASFSEYGRVVDVRIAVDDRSGAFTGAALLRMSTVDEAVAASEGLNGATLKGYELVSGVLDDRLNVVSLRHGTVIQRADTLVPEDCDLTVNDRRWV